MDQRVRSSSEDILAEPIPGGYSLTTAATPHASTWPARSRAGAPTSTRRRGRACRATRRRDRRRVALPADRAAGAQDQDPQVERARTLTPVFGTSCPPHGLSGSLRDFAYSFSEGRIAHWLTLMLADRVNVVEDVLLDLAQGRVPNIPKEMGLASELKYNRAGLARKAAIALVAIAAVTACLRMQREAYRLDLARACRARSRGWWGC